MNFTTRPTTFRLKPAGNHRATYLLFLKRLDDLHTLEENKAARLKTPVERRTTGAGSKGRPYEDLRWSRFKNLVPAEMFTVVNEHLFPFLRPLRRRLDLRPSHEGRPVHESDTGRYWQRTPRHIIRLMVEMMEPSATDVIGDPACGTAGFLVSAGEHLRERHPEILRDASREHFHHGMFHGFDFDNTTLRMGSMNMLLHGVENPDIRYDAAQLRRPLLGT